MAELHERHGQLDAALAVLEQAIAWDPDAEELYRRVMRLQATLGHPDGVRRTYHQLVQRLDELGEDADDATTRLLAELVGKRRRQPA